jgi:DNA-binding HxlR family transcriptional regulator
MNTSDHQFMPEQGEACDKGDEQVRVMERALRLIGDMWTLAIVYNLIAGTKRFGELLDALGNVSPKTLSQRLKMLEECGIVQRQAYPEIPPRVEYRLTEKGSALVHVLEAIRDFGMRYLGDPPTS